MKFLVIGLGSMGKRRIRNLLYLGNNDIIGYDPKKERREESEIKYKIKTYDDIQKALNQKPDALIISTPPNHHIEYELLAAQNNIHFFCEAGVLIDNVEDLIKLSKKKRIIAAPSATFRFNESIKKIKKLVDDKKIGKICALTYHMGQWLPDWHPWESITKFYVGKRETSATREMVPFELEWLTWIFGDIKTISCIKGKTSNLLVDIDDVYQIIFEFENGILGHLLIEVISRTPTRILRIVGDKGTIEWNWIEDIVKLYDYKKKRWIVFKEKRGFKEKGYVAKENMYIEEMKNFINAIKGKEKFIYSLEEDFKLLQLLQSVEKSSTANIHVSLKGGKIRDSR
jgi:predicted dehydrogenase